MSMAILFRCGDCNEIFAEDDLEQIQPDGRYACPLHDVGSNEGMTLWLNDDPGPHYPALVGLGPINDAGASVRGDRDFWQDDILTTEVADAVALALSVEGTTNEMLLGCIIDGIYKAGWGLVYLAADDADSGSRGSGE